MPTFEKRKADDIVHFAKHTKRRACEAHHIKHEFDVADDDSDGDTAPQVAPSVDCDSSTLPSAQPKHASRVLRKEESDGDECQVIEQQRQFDQAHEASRVRKCLDLFKTFPNAAGITIEELLKCWIQYALSQSGDEALDFSNWLHSQSALAEQDTVTLDRLFKLSPPADMLQTICDKLGKCFESAEATSGGMKARSHPAQTLETATALAETPVTQDAGAAFDPDRYRSLEKSERVQMAKVHFPNAQKLFQYHATVNNAISIKIASRHNQSPERLFHETWSRLDADFRSEWEQLLFRLHKDGLKKPVGTAGQRLLEQQRTVAVVAAVIASSDASLHASEALADQPDSQNAVLRPVNQDNIATCGFDCVWSFNEKRFPFLSQEERSNVAKAHFPTCLHLLAYHIRMHEATSCLVDWQDSDQVRHRLSRVWQTFPWQIQKSWELRLSNLHKDGARRMFRKKARRLMELDRIKPILMKFISPEQSISYSDADPLHAGSTTADRRSDTVSKTLRSTAESSGNLDSSQPNFDALSSDTDALQKATVFVDFVAWSRKPGFSYILLPVNTPQVPISDATLGEIEKSCRVAYEGQASVVEVVPLGSQAWGICLQVTHTDGPGLKRELLGRHVSLRGFKMTTCWLPSSPANVFSADISRHADLEATRVLLQLRRGLSRHNLPVPTMMEQRNGTRRRLLVYFPRAPGLFVFFIPAMVPGLTIPYNIFFRGFDQTVSCWVCRMYHGDQVCPMAISVTAS